MTNGKVENIRDMAIDTLGLTTTTRNRLVEWVHQGKSLSPKERESLASSTTVGQIMEKYEKFSFWNIKGQVSDRSSIEVNFLSRLRELGITEQEWAHLASTPTATMELLLTNAAKKGKDHLFALNIRMLGRCISREVQGELVALFDKPITDITIGDLILAPRELWEQKYFKKRWWDSNGLGFFEQELRGGLVVARQRLLELGIFPGKDSYFFEISTEDSVTKKIAEDLKISKRKAKEFLRYAQANGWGPKVQFKD